MPPVMTQDEEPFRLSNSEPRPKRKKRRMRASPQLIALLANYIHREDFTRQELAAKFGLKLKELQKIIREQGWQSSGNEDEDENNEPLPNPSPSVFVPCPYKAGSDAKIWMLSERYARRLPLWHPNDNPRKVKQRLEDPLCREAPQKS